MDSARSRNRNQSGFNLIEVMVALGILAFGILAVASMQDTSLLATSRAYRITDGTSIAMEKMEHLISRAYTDAQLASTGGAYVPYATPTQGQFTIDYAVSTNVDKPALPFGCKEIKVRVRWTLGGGAPRTTVLTCTKERV